MSPSPPSVTSPASPSSLALPWRDSNYSSLKSGPGGPSKGHVLVLKGVVWIGLALYPLHATGPINSAERATLHRCYISIKRVYERRQGLLGTFISLAAAAALFTHPCVKGIKLCMNKSLANSQILFKGDASPTEALKGKLKCFLKAHFLLSRSKKNLKYF